MKLNTVAVLNTGEMGHMIALVLRKHGLKVVTCLEGRSERTRQFAAVAGVSNLPTIEEVVMASDIIMSVVVPSATEELASAVAKAIAKTKRPVLFADANAISPMTSTAIGEVISAAGGRYVDACIVGGARDVGKSTTFYVSGRYSQEFVLLQNFGLTVKVLGDRIGQASAFKMVYAGLTKGLTCLLMELLMTAYSLGILDQIMEKYRCRYPEIAGFIERRALDFPLHAQRRSEEMEELTRTIEKAGIRPIMAPASQQLLKSIGDLDLRSVYPDFDETQWNIKDVIDIIYSRLTKAD